jgi:hypothetical protein
VLPSWFYPFIMDGIESSGSRAPGGEPNPAAGSTSIHLSE